jgi:N-acetyl sugar amidotransferase
MTENYQICSRCIMDTSDPDIQFDSEGICNHCCDAIKRLNQYPYNLDAKAKQEAREDLLVKIKLEGKNKVYDCVIGVSGGVDSTYVVYLAKQLGLRPLAVHLDNGWNSELAVHNIEKICKQLDVHLFTYIIDWQEFRDIQLSFLKASTPDSEIPTDHAISAILYQVAVKNKLKYIITGDNFNSESILPFAWSHGHNDWKYIRSIQKQFGSVSFKTFPRVSYFKLFYYNFIKPIKKVNLLNVVDFNKSRAEELLKEKLDWESYGGKHHESIYTKFFQSYILPVKFGFDKRKAHLSSLICAGQISRDEALKELENPLIQEPELSQDREYVAAKLGLSLDRFQSIMEAPIKNFWNYPSYENSWYYKFARMLYRFLTGRKGK